MFHPAKEGSLSNEAEDAAVLKLESEMLTVLHCYNYYYRLKIADRTDYSELIQHQRQHPLQADLLPVQLPCEFVDERLWESGSDEARDKAWIGHGFFWKFGEGPLNKDNKF